MKNPFRNEDTLVKDSVDAGEEFARQWLHDGGIASEFDGQSEAVDIAAGSGLDAEYVYEGMLKVIRAHPSYDTPKRKGR